HTDPGGPAILTTIAPPGSGVVAVSASITSSTPCNVPTNIAIASANHTFTYSTSTLTSSASSRSAIQGFLSQRANMITSMGPDTARLHERLTGTLFGGRTGPNPQTFSLGGPREDQAFAQRPTLPGFAIAGAGVREALASDRDALARDVGNSGANRPIASPLA